MARRRLSWSVRTRTPASVWHCTHSMIPKAHTSALPLYADAPQHQLQALLAAAPAHKQRPASSPPFRPASGAHASLGRTCIGALGGSGGGGGGGVSARARGAPARGNMSSDDAGRRAWAAAAAAAADAAGAAGLGAAPLACFPRPSTAWPVSMGSPEAADALSARLGRSPPPLGGTPAAATPPQPPPRPKSAAAALCPGGGGRAATAVHWAGALGWGAPEALESAMAAASRPPGSPLWLGAAAARGAGAAAPAAPQQYLPSSDLSMYTTWPAKAAPPPARLPRRGLGSARASREGALVGSSSGGSGLGDAAPPVAEAPAPEAPAEPAAGGGAAPEGGATRPEAAAAAEDAGEQTEWCCVSAVTHRGDQTDAAATADEGTQAGVGTAGETAEPEAADTADAGTQAGAGEAAAAAVSDGEPAVPGGAAVADASVSARVSVCDAEAQGGALASEAPALDDGSGGSSGNRSGSSSGGSGGGGTGGLCSLRELQLLVEAHTDALRAAAAAGPARTAAGGGGPPGREGGEEAAGRARPAPAPDGAALAALLAAMRGFAQESLRILRPAGGGGGAPPQQRRQQDEAREAGPAAEAAAGEAVAEAEEEVEEMLGVLHQVGYLRLGPFLVACQLHASARACVHVCVHC